MAPDAVGISPPKHSWSPAPYGRACLGCSRAKCKCFYLSEGSGCERCHRLRKACEPASTVRRRRPRRAPPVTTDGSSHVTLEASAVLSQPTHLPTPESTDTPSTDSMAIDYDGLGYQEMAPAPDLIIDSTASVVQLVRPVTPTGIPSPIIDDVSIHQTSSSVENEQLDIFRRSILPTFPFVHIPVTMSTTDLRQEKPFLWLVIMALSTRNISRQFDLEKTVWKIISQRIVVEHFADLDLLLGLVCFASWSHYFKKDKPFMSMLTSLAASLALDLGLQDEIPAELVLRSKSGCVVTHQAQRQHPRTLEEHRTMLSVFALTSSAWAAYRKSFPLHWTSYMDTCVQALENARETALDNLLIVQVRCHAIANKLNFPSPEESVEVGAPKAISPGLIAAALSELTAVRKNLPAQIRLERGTQFHIYHTELTIRELVLSTPVGIDQTGTSQVKRLRDLDAVLTTVECWLALALEMGSDEWVGINVDSFTQFTHCLVVAYKLTILDEPGWDLAEVKRRVDVLDLLDRFWELLDRAPAILGMVDAPGPRRGLFFQAPYLVRAIKALFLAGMVSAKVAPGMPVSPGSSGDSDELGMDPGISENFIFNLAEEPWLSDAFDTSWDLGAVTYFDTLPIA